MYDGKLWHGKLLRVTRWVVHKGSSGRKYLLLFHQIVFQRDENGKHSGQPPPHIIGTTTAAYVANFVISVCFIKGRRLISM